MEIITDLNTLCNNCGFFDSTTTINSGYGCKHKDCREGEFLDSKENYIERPEIRIALSLTKRNIKCNKRLAKKYIKKARKMNWDEQKIHLKKLGINYFGKCFSFSCPISYEVSFEGLSSYKNGKDFDDIENEEDMPQGFGEELMALDVDQAELLGIVI